MAQRSPADLTDFGYLFPDLQEDPEALLPRSRDTLMAFDRLGDLMVDTDENNENDSSIPAAYTYFGQFVDHDIVLEARSSEIASINSPDLEPLLQQQVFHELKNTRSASLDLDSVYGHPALRKGRLLRLGKVQQAGTTRATQDLFHDLFRQGRMPDDPEHDREALIGDPRNDESLIVAQLHVAFLRAHKALVKEKEMSFEEARRALRQHYQWIVIHDFLEQIADPEIAKNTRIGNRFYQSLREPFFLPLEFTAAAFRFGHSMVRSQYLHNVSFPKAQLGELFAFTGRGGFRSRPDRRLPRELPGVGFDTLPDAWVIDWSGFVGPEAHNKARKIDTFLVDPLRELQAVLGPLLQGEPRLAVRNLRRGYLLRMPTGQAVARKFGLEPLEPGQISAVVPLEQALVLDGAGLLERTPLWYYILAEAKHHKEGNRLGPVGSTLVAEVLVGLVRRSTDSILSGDGNWKPSLGTVEGRFDLPDLLRFAGVLPPERPPVPAPA